MGTSQDSGTGKGGLRLRLAAGIVAAVLACTAAALFAARHYGLMAPSWVPWTDRSLACDFDADGTAEQVTLSARRVRVHTAEGGTLFESDRSWRVQDVLADDVTGDGRPELVMLVWRRGNYGNSRPFWEDGIDLRMTQHLYIMGIEEGATEMRAVWMSHELGHGFEVTEMRAHDGNRLTLITRQGDASTWQWDFFGFALVE